MPKGGLKLHVPPFVNPRKSGFTCIYQFNYQPWEIIYFFLLGYFKRIATLSVDKQIDQAFTSTMGTDKRFRLY